MRLFLPILAAVAFVACREIAEPFDPIHCYRVGDTSYYSFAILSTDSTILYCHWQIETAVRCVDGEKRLYTASDCVEGTKWKG